MRYWDVFDLALRNIYVYAKKAYDVELLDVFAVFRWSLLKRALIMVLEGKVDVDKLTMDEYLEEIVEKFKEALAKAKWIETARKLEEKVHRGIEEVYEKYEKESHEEAELRRREDEILP